MSPGTHALASIAIVRGFFPRQRFPFLLGVVLAGCLADLDLLTLSFGPDAYLSGRMTWTHSVLGTAAVIALAGLLGRWLERKIPPAKADPTMARGSVILLAASVAAILHLVLDAATSQGVALLWPLLHTRIAWDLLPSTDAWIILALAAGILLPELFALISSEIGAKDKAPRGRSGARIGLVFIGIYIGVRILLHANAVAQLDAHSYRGESPHRVAALPDSLSIFAWHGIAETNSQTCTVDVPATSASRFDSEAAVCVHKPEPSASLAIAQQTDAAQRFLAAARYPKASVGTVESGTEVVIRDMRDVTEGESRFAMAARVLLDTKPQVTSQHIVWARDLHLR